MAKGKKKKPFNEYPPALEQARERFASVSDSISKMQEIFKDAHAAMQKAFEPIIEVSRAFDSHFFEIGKLWESAKIQNRESYDRQFESLIHYLRKEGYIVPADYKEFADWFFFEKHGQLPVLAEDLVKIGNVTPSDFREFHEFKKTQFLQNDSTELLVIHTKPPSQLGAGNLFLNSFDDLFFSDAGRELAIEAAQKVGLIVRVKDNWQWEYPHTTGAIVAYFQALNEVPGLIRKVNLTKGCKLIAARFSVSVVKNYPEANFTHSLRKLIYSYLKEQG